MSDENTPCSSVAASPGSVGMISVPVLLGPTAAGKSGIAFALARETGWEILSCDSRQLYRGMDIGTAKPSAAERAQVPHWLTDILEPSEEYSAGRFADEAAAIIRNRAKRGKRVLLCGGTGLYFKALQRGSGDRAPSDPALREALMQFARNNGSGALHRELVSVDPETAARLHPNDIQRIVRALALFRQTGTRLSDVAPEGTPPGDMRFSVIKLTMERSLLYDRINRRVDAMMRDGLRKEFRALAAAGYDRQSPGMRTVGYREFFDVENGTITESEAVALIQRNSRRYAKRQITWFSRQVEGMEVDASVTARALQAVRHHFLKR